MNTLLLSSLVGVGLLSIPVWNVFSTPQLKSYQLDKEDSKAKLPFVSVIVPMRNEADNMKKSLRAILASDYPSFEVVLIDDNSTDGTFDICLQIISEYNAQDKVKLISGKELPKGWMGKQWALEQAASHAKGELFLFMDADVYLSPSSISKVVAAKRKEKAMLVSFYPDQIKGSFSETLMVPLMTWALHHLLPIYLANHIPHHLLSACTGQLMMLSSKDYHALGRHEAFKHEIVEDMAIVKAVKKKGGKSLLGSAKSEVYCRMYTDFWSCLSGFSKNAFSIVELPWIVYFVLLTVLIGVHLFAFIAPFISLAWLPLTVSVVLLRLCIAHVAGEKKLLNVVLYPLQLVMFYVIALRSLYLTVFDKVEWKGRKYKIN